MNRLTEDKLVLIVRRSRLDDLISRFNTEDQARFYVEHLGANFSDYQLEDRRYKQAIEETETILARFGRLQVVDRSFVPNFIFGPNDTVIALGQDGLVANTLKYLDGQPLIGVNPDTQRYEGVLLPFRVSQLAALLPEVLTEQRPVREVSIAQVNLNTGEVLFGVNDLFIGPRSHTSARYSIRLGDRAENHSSSGIIVSTGLGASGWFRSIMAGASGITSALTGETLNLNRGPSIQWDSDYLYFCVREPWPSKNSQASITFGTITPETPLTLVSQMPEHGIIFSDGIEADFIQFNSGTEASIGIADRKGKLVI